MDHYRVLGLTYTADASAIRQAYRTLAKRYHPDVSTLPDAQERFIAITQAYEVLSDPVARDRYDRTRESPSPKRASPATEARYARSTEARQRAARTHAEEYGRMRYEQFDADLFDSVAGYVAPKMLGCLGIALLAGLLFVAIMFVAQQVEALRGLLITIALLGFMPAIVYGSMQFDDWHNRRQAAKKHGRYKQR